MCVCGGRGGEGEGMCARVYECFILLGGKGGRGSFSLFFFKSAKDSYNLYKTF